MKPKALIDIKGAHSSKIRNAQINLRYYRIIRIPLKSIISIGLLIFVIASFFNSVIAPTNGDAFAAQTNAADERKALEAQLTQLETQIDNYQGKIDQYEKQGSSLKSEINTLNAKISKINLQIKAITLTLQKVNYDLSATQTQIATTTSQIDLKRQDISQILQAIYQNDNQGFLTILLTHAQISDFFNEMNRLSSVQDELRSNVEDLMNLNNQLSDQKQSLASEKQDVMSLKTYQEAQMQAIQQTKSDKNNLLAVTKGQESKYKQILAVTQQTAAQIRSRIFQLIGGGQLSFGDAYKFAQIAESKTGVKASLILAVLDRESALGANVGKCRYDINPYYPTRASNPTTMSPTRDIPIFLQITSALGLDPKTTLVSCPIPADGAYGGAMGPAQFIPSTWDIYSDRIASLTGNNPTSPWNDEDAFMATALYLKDAGAAGGSLYAEKVAAAKYYAGARWYNYMSTYGAAVIDRAQEFDQDIATLNGQTSS